MESGSQNMLGIMETVTKVEQNYNVIKWLVEKKFTTVQLVIGMPGETPDTIEKTSRFTSYVVEQSPEVDPNALSINFAQALPSIPLYEVARRKGKKVSNNILEKIFTKEPVGVFFEHRI